MKSILLYLLQVVTASGLLYGYYHLFLRNKKFHQYNRFYLLAIVFISVLIPFLRIPFYYETPDMVPATVIKTLQAITYQEIPEQTEIVSTTAHSAGSFSWFSLAYWFYGILSLMLLMRILFSLKKIRSLIRSNPVEELSGIHFVNTIDSTAPFSFFRWMFWHRAIELDSKEGQQIFRHEIFHIRQKHSFDIIFIEFVGVIFWINPFFFFIRKELKAIHEFLADRFATTEDTKWEYSELLLMQALNTRNQLANAFFHNQIKRRIAMITNPQKTSHQYLRKILALPLAALVIFLFAFKYEDRGHSKPTPASKPLTIIVDPGHGGTDAGVTSPDGKYNEASLSLEIAQTIKRIAPEYNISVVLTRESNTLPGGSVTKEQALKKIVSLTEENNAEAFISIHINTNGKPQQYQEKSSGFEAYVSAKRNDDDGKQLAAAILENLSQIYSTEKNVRLRNEAGIYVLDKNYAPSLLLECGYINNKADLSFVSDKSNQEKIAHKILAAISNYPHSVTVNESDESNQTENTSAELTNTEVIKSDITEKKSVSVADNASIAESKSDDNIEYQTEIEPSFPGGITTLDKFVAINTDASIPQKKGAEPGTYTVYIQFLVGEDGSLSDIKPLTNHGFGMEEEAMRVIKKGPNWIPGKKNGKIVAAYKKQPITFVIVGEDVVETTTTLPGVVMIAYTDQVITPEMLKDQSTPPSPSTEIGSIDWKKYLQRNINSIMPLRDGWKAGDHQLTIQFTRKEDGSITDVKALNYAKSKTAAQCVKLFQNFQSTKPAANTSSETMTYFQPLTFTIIKDKKLAVNKTK